MLSFGHELLNGWLIGSSSHSSWYAGLIQAPWALAKETYGPICTVYYAVLSLSIWNLWRRYSLRNLKLEVSVFFAQFFFQIVWASSFFVLQETLLALVVLLLLCCNHLLSALLFWKKDSSSGGLLLLSFFWIFYVMGLNMVICISNP
ncbi:MAG: tryptophan-rich sensory protein [Chlamydiota bacterium]